MGGKYQVIGREYGSPCDDINIYTYNLCEAIRAFRKAKKMYYCAFIIRNYKYAREIENE